jgi:hypothetical protein
MNFKNASDSLMLVKNIVYYLSFTFSIIYFSISGLNESITALTILKCFREDIYEIAQQHSSMIWIPNFLELSFIASISEFSILDSVLSDMSD